jgi:hypothetical protein
MTQENLADFVRGAHRRAVANYQSNASWFRQWWHKDKPTVIYIDGTLASKFLQSEGVSLSATTIKFDGMTVELESHKKNSGDVVVDVNSGWPYGCDYRNNQSLVSTQVLEQPEIVRLLSRAINAVEGTYQENISTLKKWSHRDDPLTVYLAEPLFDELATATGHGSVTGLTFCSDPIEFYGVQVHRGMHPEIQNEVGFAVHSCYTMGLSYSLLEGQRDPPSKPSPKTPTITGEVALAQ